MHKKSAKERIATSSPKIANKKNIGECSDMSNKLDYLGTLDGFERVTKNVGAQNTKTINYQRLNYKLNYLTSLYHTRGRFMLYLYSLDI